jgi:hypothetical protein
MKIVVLSCAESEFAEIVDYYNEQAFNDKSTNI